MPFALLPRQISPAFSVEYQKSTLPSKQVYLHLQANKNSIVLTDPKEVRPWPGKRVVHVCRVVSARRELPCILTKKARQYLETVRGVGSEDGGGTKHQAHRRGQRQRRHRRTVHRREGRACRVRDQCLWLHEPGKTKMTDAARQELERAGIRVLAANPCAQRRGAGHQQKARRREPGGIDGRHPAHARPGRQGLRGDRGHGPGRGPDSPR